MAFQSATSAQLLHDGLWPTMVTPFGATGEIDFVTLERMVEWYVRQGAAGLFAVCLSSEMLHLTLAERVTLARQVMRFSGSAAQVVAGGVISTDISDICDEAKAIAECGALSVVLPSNTLAAQSEPDEIWKRNADRVLAACPNVMFGLYECPKPYKRLISLDLLNWCVSTGRFNFLKDTSCDVAHIRAKLSVGTGSKLKIFNANGPTLLESLRAGAHGYCGVLGNFFPAMVARLIHAARDNKEEAEILQNFLGPAAVSAEQDYPAIAKYSLSLENLGITTRCRSMDGDGIHSQYRLVIDQLRKHANLVNQQADLCGGTDEQIGGMQASTPAA